MAPRCARLFLLLPSLGAPGMGPPRRITIAPATGQTGIAALGLLRRACATSEHSDVEVVALCRNEREREACRMAVCGALCVEGKVRDMCSLSFSRLQAKSVLSAPANQWQLEGTTALIILSDEIHPIMERAGEMPECVVTFPSRWGPQTIQYQARCLMLIDAAAAAGVQHVILHSSIGASGRMLNRVNVARMGGSDHLSLRRSLEERLKQSTRELGTRLTVLQAAPYATPAQLSEHLRTSEDEGEPEHGLGVAPLTLPECMARCAVDAALAPGAGSRLRRCCVTRTVISAGSPGWGPSSPVP